MQEVSQGTKKCPPPCQHTLTSSSDLSSRTSSTSGQISIRSDITGNNSTICPPLNFANEDKPKRRISYSAFLQEKLNIVGHPSADDLLLFFAQKLLTEDDSAPHRLDAIEPRNRQIIQAESESTGAVARIEGGDCMIRDVIRRVYNATVGESCNESRSEKSQECKAQKSQHEGSVGTDFCMDLNRNIQPEKDERYIVHKDDEDGVSADTSILLSQTSLDSVIQLFHPSLSSLHRKAPTLVQSFEKDLCAVQALVTGFKVVSKYFTTLINLVQRIRKNITKDVKEANQERSKLAEYEKEIQTWEEAGFDEIAAKEIVRVCGVKLTILEGAIDRMLAAYERRDRQEEEEELQKSLET